MSIETTSEAVATSEVTETTSDPAVTGTTAVVEDKAAPKEPAVDLKLWARTNAAARESAAQVKTLELKLKDLESKLAINPDEQTARQAALSTMLQEPGAAKKLLEHGWTFEKIVAELTDIETVDPQQIALQARMDKLEADRKAEIDAFEKARSEQVTKADQEAIAEARQSITAYASNPDRNKVVDDPKDPRAGTNRWAAIQGNDTAMETARAAAVAYIGKHHLGGVTAEQAESLVNQGLDQLELEERKRLEPVMARLTKTTPPISKTRTDLSTRVTEQPDQLLKPTPKTITSDLRNPAPLKQPKKLYNAGPRKITYT
jgi:hypothetical protein